MKKSRNIHFDPGLYSRGVSVMYNSKTHKPLGYYLLMASPVTVYGRICYFMAYYDDGKNKIIGFWPSLSESIEFLLIAHDLNNKTL